MKLDSCVAAGRAGGGAGSAIRRRTDRSPRRRDSKRWSCACRFGEPRLADGGRGGVGAAACKVVADCRAPAGRTAQAGSRGATAVRTSGGAVGGRASWAGGAGRFDVAEDGRGAGLGAARWGHGLVAPGGEAEDRDRDEVAAAAREVAGHGHEEMLALMAGGREVDELAWAGSGLAAVTSGVLVGGNRNFPGARCAQRRLARIVVPRRFVPGANSL